MNKTADMLRAAKQARQISKETADKTQLTYTLGAGVTCILAIGLALCAHVGFEVILETLKPNMRSVQNDTDVDADESMRRIAHANQQAEDRSHISSKHGHSANDAVKRYYALQLEELAKYKLSGTERRIAALILHGETNRNIAERMHLAESTIKKHVQKILSKTGAANRKEFSHIIRECVERRPL